MWIPEVLLEVSQSVARQLGSELAASICWLRLPIGPPAGPDHTDPNLTQVVARRGPLARDNWTGEPVTAVRSIPNKPIRTTTSRATSNAIPMV
jgi:hypothetical protein